MAYQIPRPALGRLCALYQLLCDLELEGVMRVSSSDIGARLGYEAHNIRKDISYLSESGNVGNGYDTLKLKVLISEALGLGRRRNACITGLGRLGWAILEQSNLLDSEFRLVAGFDSNVNLLETIRTSVPVFPAYELGSVIREKAIELGIIAVPALHAQEIADRLVEAGVKGILNFAPIVIRVSRKGVFVRNMDIVGELRMVSALVNIFANTEDK